ncbi:nickel pincer cofactor biosynthesis protein LarC [Telmatobacter bradus]|uniref:nickel pincer cofactor biosynthesis protein LarC n=1 Tax=Telmatobacter bradus TaxID=474953 RepID=UPI003B439F14
MRIGSLECFSGISGDMLLGALVDAGVPFELLDETARSLNVGAHLAAYKVMRGGLSATKVDVLTAENAPAEAEHPHGHEHAHAHTHEHSHEHSHEQEDAHGYEYSHEYTHDHESLQEHTHAHAEHTHAPHRHLSTILQIIADAPLSEFVKTLSNRAFQLLGEAEASIHSIPVEKVHFHEVGAVDTIVDLVCTAAGVEWLKVDRWISSPLNVGSGTVKCQHGTLPVPAPATLALIADAPIYSAGSAMERVTPTGATVLRMLDVHYEELPAVRVVLKGYGAGGRDVPGEPNLLRFLVGEVEEKKSTSSASEPIAVLTTVIDDSNPQVLAYVSERLLEAGAWDVYRVAVQMKKGRTGVELTVLSRPDLIPVLEEILFRETTTIGLHWRVENKSALKREFVEVTTQWGAVHIKIARLGSGKIANASPEFEDCRKLALAQKIPLKQVMSAALRAFAASTTEEV